jgi:hypothetical protein
VASVFGDTFTCFGLRISLVLRFCPLAMAECPFEEN